MDLQRYVISFHYREHFFLLNMLGTVHHDFFYCDASSEAGIIVTPKLTQEFSEATLYIE